VWAVVGSAFYLILKLGLEWDIIVHLPSSLMKRACSVDYLNDEYDPGDPLDGELSPEYMYGFSDPAVLQSGSGDITRTLWTPTAENPQNGLTPPDTDLLKAGEDYELGVRERECQWMYEDEISRSDLDDEHLHQLLRLLPPTTLNTDCSMPLKVVGEYLKKRGLRDYVSVGFEFIRAKSK
jgi:hypothetical protein